MDKFLIRQGGSNSHDKPLEENASKKKAPSTSGTRKRKYNEEFLQYGFVESENDDSLPYCLLCQKTLSNESLTPAKLLRHLELKHPVQAAKSIEARISYYKALQTNRAQVACNEIAQILTKNNMPHSEAEEIIFPALKIAVEGMLTDDADALEKIKQLEDAWKLSYSKESR